MPCATNPSSFQCMQVVPAGVIAKPARNWRTDVARIPQAYRSQNCAGQKTKRDKADQAQSFAQNINLIKQRIKAERPD